MTLCIGPQPEWGKEFTRVVGNESSAEDIWRILTESLDSYRQDINGVFESLMKSKFTRGSFFTTPFGNYIEDSLDEGLKQHPEGQQIRPNDKALELFRSNEDLLLSLPGSFPFPPRTGDLYEDIQAVVEKARKGVPQGKPMATLPATIPDPQNSGPVHFIQLPRSIPQLGWLHSSLLAQIQRHILERCLLHVLKHPANYTTTPRQPLANNPALCYA